MLLLSALLSLVGLASAAVCTLDADEIDGSGQLNSTCRAHTPQLLVGTAPSTRFAWSSTVEDEMDLYVGEEGTGVLRIEGFGGADWAGGYLQLKAGDVDDPSFQIATLTAERGTDNKTIFSAQKRDVDGGYKGQLFNYLDDQGWNFYTAPSGTSGSQQQAMQIEQGGRMRIKMQDFSSAPSASNGGTQIADSHSGNIILSSGSGTTLANLQLFSTATASLARSSPRAPPPHMRPHQIIVSSRASSPSAARLTGLASCYRSGSTSRPNRQRTRSTGSWLTRCSVSCPTP